MTYIGRFAPSPTGALHLGTLTAAIASYLHARQSKGSWLVRIEDIDPPREIAGSADRILKALEALDLHWDGAVLYQSTRLERYLATARQLIDDGKAFHCSCSRQQIRAKTGGSRYPGTCRDKALGPGDTAIRLRIDGDAIAFDDYLQGPVTRDIRSEDGDFVIVRRDGLPAYHLAVVMDDAEQGVTDIVRGVDLLDSTPLHVYLQRCLGLATPRYWHIPLVMDAAGEKLSKRAGAAEIERDRPESAAAAALELLGLAIPRDLQGAPPDKLWHWAAQTWQIEGLARIDRN